MIAVSFFVYENVTLFPSTLLVNKSHDNNKEVERIVGSYVISATVEGIEVKNLSDDSPVEIMFALNNMNKVSVAGYIHIYLYNVDCYMLSWLRHVYLKGHWTTSASSPNFFFNKVEIFIPLEVYTYVVTACSILLATSAQL